MLGGQDWPFAGPSLRHHGGGAWARCLAAYSCSLHHVNLRGACSNWQARGFRWRTERNSLLQTLAGLFGVILSLLLSPTLPPPPPSWANFGAPCDSGQWFVTLRPERSLVKGLLVQWGKPGRQMRSEALYLSGLLPQRLDREPRFRTLSILGVGPSASSPTSHVKGAQEQKCLLGEYCCRHRWSRRRGEGMERKGLEWIMRV